jgi:hypothetical protein
MIAYHTIVETNGHSSREGSEPGMDRRYARTRHLVLEDSIYMNV